MANLNDLREACKALDGLVLPFLAAVIILYWLLHDGHEHKQIEVKLDALSTKIDESVGRVDTVLNGLNDHIRQLVIERINGRNIPTTVEAGNEAMQKAVQEKDRQKAKVGGAFDTAR